MQEIEVKILDINTQEITKKLLSYGAKKMFEGDMNITFFDFEDHRLKKEEKILRLRNEGTDHVLCTKGKIKKGKTKSAEETETKVEDPEATIQLLESIGLQKQKQIKKHRIHFKLDNIHFEIDTLEGIPTFLEIEAPDEKSIEYWVQKLGFTMEMAKPWTGGDVMKYYAKISSPS